MAIQKITYTNKEDLNIDPTVPAINKVVAADMNEIKNVINNNADELEHLDVPPEIAVQTTQPSAEGLKLWINPEDIPSGSLNPITNEYSIATDKGYSCNYLNNSDSYSTSEVKTNKRWIDGKPIYRKVFQLDITATDTWLTAPNSIISNYQTATYMGGIYGGYSPIPVYVNDSYSIAIQYNSSAGVQAYSKGFGSGGMYIIVEYTKTTD